MATVRVVSAESEPLLSLHLRRIGYSASEAATLAHGRTAWQLLLTGLSPVAVQAFEGLPALPAVLLGNPDRAPGTLLLSGRRAQIEEAAGELSARGGELAGVSRLIGSALDHHAGHPAPTQIGPKTFEWGTRTYLMGVVNVTPDSFSDGGQHADPDTAVAAGERLALEGADLVDVGGESSRPGAEPVPVEQELERVIPVVERLARLVDVPVSVDTTKAAVAEAAIRAGATFVNDISGLLSDPEMAPTCARHEVGVCVMHLRGTPRTMQQDPRYLDVVGEVLEGLAASLAVAARCGIPESRLVVDPGIGFGKTAEQNLFLLRNLGQLRGLGCPVLVGASRKSFIGAVTGRPVGERLSGSLAVVTSAILAGADLVRVHDVAETALAAQVVEAIQGATEGGLSFAAD